MECKPQWKPHIDAAMYFTDGAEGFLRAMVVPLTAGGCDATVWADQRHHATERFDTIDEAKAWCEREAEWLGLDSLR